MGAIVARRLHNNSLIGDSFGGIYATRVANFLEIPIQENDMELPLAYLDYNAMVSHHFLERNEQFFQYQRIFDRWCTVHVALPAPTFFDFQEKRRYVITREEANEYERRTKVAHLQTAALEAVAAASQYDPNYNFGYPPGHLWH